MKITKIQLIVLLFMFLCGCSTICGALSLLFVDTETSYTPTAVQPEFFFVTELPKAATVIVDTPTHVFTDTPQPTFTNTPEPTFTNTLLPTNTAVPVATKVLCDPSYPSVCIAPYPPDLDCGDVPYTSFVVLRPDPHKFDKNKDGIGCEP